MKHTMQSLALAAALVLITFNAVAATTALAQDPTQQAIQANQQAAQAAQQASQQAMQDAQQAAQTAQQMAQQAAQATSSSTLPPRVNPPIVPRQPYGPLPAQIASAHRILLTNGGNSVRLNVDSNQLYNDIHARLAAWGYYQLVSTPQDADLIFQLDEIAPHAGDNITAATDVYDRTPTFRLTLSDAHTSTVLWTITSPIVLTGSRKTSAHWLDVSEQNLLSRIKVVAGQPLTNAESAELTQFPNTHRTLAAGLIVGGTVAFGVGGGLLLHHLYENGLASQKAQQDAFCKANNIPLSECAGG